MYAVVFCDMDQNINIHSKECAGPSNVDAKVTVVIHDFIFYCTSIN